MMDKLISRKTRLAHVVALVSTVMLQACGDGPQQATGTQETPGDTTTIAATAEPVDLDLLAFEHAEMLIFLSFWDGMTLEEEQSVLAALEERGDFSGGRYVQVIDEDTILYHYEPEIFDGARGEIIITITLRSDPQDELTCWRMYDAWKRKYGEGEYVDLEGKNYRMLDSTAVNFGEYFERDKPAFYQSPAGDGLYTYEVHFMNVKRARIISTEYL